MSASPTSPSPFSSTRSSFEQHALLPQETSTAPIPPMELLRSMSTHSHTLRSYPSGSSSPPTEPPSRRGSDIESAGSDWGFLTAKRRQTRRSFIFIAIILSSGLVYTLVDNFFIADWVSARSRFRPTYLGGSDDLLNIPDFPDPALEAASWLGNGVVRIPNDESHVLVSKSPSLHSFDLLNPRHRFPSSLLIPLYSSGDLPLDPLPPIPDPTLDIVYTFVNASSPVLLEAKDIRAQREGLENQKGGSHHWRDNGEIRGAIRSAAHFLADGLRKVHVISADFELDSISPVSDLLEEDDYEYPEEGRHQWRVGQVPTWLNTSAGDMGVQWHFHSEIFRLPSDGAMLDQRVHGEWGNEESWRDEALPSFNSFQIESKVGWVKDLAENFILSNDDMFFLRDLTASDFHHPLLGTVFRVAPDNVNRVSPSLDKSLKSDPGEWGGLTHANFLLSNRFYPRPRIYLAHVPKALSRSVAHEASIMFSRELSISATRGFRTSTRGNGDVHFAWLVTHLQIERWREALLWSWAVARMGGADGVWGEDARDEVWNVLGLTEIVEADGEIPQHVVITPAPRSTLEDMDAMMTREDWEFPEASRYQFTSLDGHLPSRPDAGAAPEVCIFSLPHCLPADFFTTAAPISAVDMFTHLAFVQSECGDCLIKALINASGERGLSAILPEAEQVFEPEVREREEWEREEPMLPLVSHWQQGNFSLGAVVRPGQHVWDGEDSATGPVRLVDFCVKLLSRYTYSAADSPTHFALARSPEELSRVLEGFGENEPYAMGCINDDQGDEITGGGSGQILGQWMESRFGEWEAGWEKDDWPWSHPPPPAPAEEEDQSEEAAQSPEERR